MTTEPRTEAGKRLLAGWWPVKSVRREEVTALVLAIEAEAGALDVERLADALAFAHPGPRPWPGKLTSAEFARTIAAEYARLAAPIPVADPSEAPR